MGVLHRGEILGAYPTERLSVYGCSESCGTDFSGSIGVAQSARVRTGGLFVYDSLPQARNVRLDATDATSGSLGPCQHCRRISSAWESGQKRDMNMAEASLEESRYYLILAKDLGYGDTSQLTTSLEEVSRLLNAYVSAILASDS